MPEDDLEVDPPFLLLPPRRLEAIEIRAELQNGASKPIVVVAVDEYENKHEVVLKLRHPGPNCGNHFEGTSLACELICAVLARGLGLPVLEYAIVDVPFGLVLSLPNNARNNHLAARLRPSTGDNFGMQYKEGAPDWDPRLLIRSDEIIDLLEDVLTFDASVVNADRRKAKSNLLNIGNDLFLIDHSLALSVFIPILGASSDKGFLTHQQVLDHCAADHLAEEARSFSAVTDRWAKSVDKDILTQMRAMIPPTWEQSRGHLDRIFEFLEERVNQLKAVSSRLRSTIK